MTTARKLREISVQAGNDSSPRRPPLTALTNAEAEQLIIDQWKTWSSELVAYTDDDMLIFFSVLEKSKPDLLLFPCSVDKWQRVRRWLRKYEDSQSKLRNPSANGGFSSQAGRMGEIA